VLNRFLAFLNKPSSIAPLSNLRVLFGFLMLWSTLRFVLYGWIETQYNEPIFHFSYFGFEWVSYPGPTWMYVLFALMILSSISIMLGLFYRVSAVIFFLSFTYVELIDLTNYLNHYYFVSLLAFMMIFLPAHKSFSIDSQRIKNNVATHVPYGFIFSVKLLLAIVYFYAGVAKLNHEWLIEALPLKIWLAPHTSLPLIGPFLDELWVAYLFSWFGAIYDLSIPFFLFSKKYRSLAFLAVVVFHITTWILFPIGMFPFIMIGLTTVFFSAETHLKIQAFFNKEKVAIQEKILYKPQNLSLLTGLFFLFFSFQILFPFRYLLYPGNLFWTEQGYRFSWRVMLMEKAGYAIFHVTDPDTGRSWELYPKDYLSPMQEKQMSTQPDMILQFAHFLEDSLKKQGISKPEIRAEVYVSLNGRGSQLFLDPNKDLTQIKDSFAPKNWILPLSNQ
tara:strand:- start:11162 stop:12499 length:1338 start_codon:yes stop_codon:yes gene_type:complete